MGGMPKWGAVDLHRKDECFGHRTEKSLSKQWYCCYQSGDVMQTGKYGRGLGKSLIIVEVLLPVFHPCYTN